MLRAQCPALRAVDLWSAGTFSPGATITGGKPALDDARARALADLPALRWLAAGSICPTGRPGGG